MFYNVTDSDLKIKVNSISVNKSVANIELLLVVKDEQVDSSFVRFDIYDVDKDTKEALDEKNYWISNYESVTSNLSNNNVNINYYKKINFFVDISNVERALFNGRRWFRRIKIFCNLFKPNNNGDYELVNLNGSWVSDTLTLLSSEVYVPSIKIISVDIFNVDENEVTKVSIKYDYGMENDFNYSNPFIDYQVLIKSPFNGKVIVQDVLQENGTKDENSTLGVIQLSFYNLHIDIDSIITVNILNHYGYVLSSRSIVYKPRRPANRTYIKWNNQVREIQSIFVNDLNEEFDNNNELNIYKNYQGVSYKEEM